VVERGSRETSLDSFLFRLAEQEGVDFEFGRAFSEQEFREAGVADKDSRQSPLAQIQFIFSGEVATGSIHRS